MIRLLPDSAEDNAARVAAVVEPLARASDGRVVFLVDGDRTLSPDDTSRTFLALAGLDPLVIKRRFQREGYVFSAFRFHAEMHVQLGEAAFAELWPYALGVLEPAQRGALAELIGREEVDAVERGSHTDGFAALHEEMTMVRRSVPGASW